MNGRDFAAACIAVTALAFAGCGGDDDGGGEKTFDADGFTITFSYPDDFEFSTEITAEERAGKESGRRAGVALDDENGIFVIRTDLNITVTSQNLSRARAELDDVTAQIFGHEVRGQETEVGGLPAVEYPPFEYPKTDVTTRLIVVFDKKDEYELNCQWDRGHTDEVQEACDLAVSTLELKSG